MTSTELLLVNGGACGGGFSGSSGGYSGGSCGGGGSYSGGYSGSYSGGSSSVSSSCGGSSSSYSGGSSSVSSSCGGSSSSYSGSSSSVSSSCGGSSSSSSGSSGSSASSSCGGSFNGGSGTSVSYGNCGGGSSYTPSINLPDKHVCTNMSDVHCDIIAWNFAIDNNLDPSLCGKNTGLDFNQAKVNTIVNTYYKDKIIDITANNCKGKKGFMIFDWGGTGKADGSWDHIEYCEFTVNGEKYTNQENNGLESSLRVTTYDTNVDSNGQGGINSKAMFIPLN